MAHNIIVLQLTSPHYSNIIQNFYMSDIYQILHLDEKVHIKSPHKSLEIIQDDHRRISLTQMTK